MIELMLASVLLTYDIPTQRMDGSVLLPEEIIEYRIYSGDEVYTTSELSLLVPAPAGENCYQIATVASNGALSEEGPRSEEACVLVPTAPPAPPSNIVIEISITISTP